MLDQIRPIPNRTDEVNIKQKERAPLLCYAENSTLGASVPAAPMLSHEKKGNKMTKFNHRDENKLREDLGFCEYCNEDADGYVKPIEKNNHAFVRFGTNGWELSLKANGWHGSAKIRYCPMCGRDLYVK